MEDELDKGNILEAVDYPMDFDILRLQWWQLGARLVQREISDLNLQFHILHPECFSKLER